MMIDLSTMVGQTVPRAGMTSCTGRSLLIKTLLCRGTNQCASDQGAFKKSRAPYIDYIVSSPSLLRQSVARHGAPVSATSVLEKARLMHRPAGQHSDQTLSKQYILPPRPGMRFPLPLSVPSALGAFPLIDRPSGLQSLRPTHS